jgi:hypothetical protein
MTAIDDAIIALTAETTLLLNAVNFSKDSLSADIAAAVLVSENASQVPLTQIATSLITTNTVFINHLTGGHA